MNQPDSASDSDVALSWSFKGNNPEGNTTVLRFVLENQGEKALGDQGWALYYNQQGLGVIDESVTGNVRIEHINGDLLRIVSPGRIQSGTGSFG